MYLKNYYRIGSSLIAILLILPAFGESKRRRALREKNNLLVALQESGPDTLAQTLRTEQSRFDTVVLDEEIEHVPMEEPAVESLETSVTEISGNIPTLTDSEHHEAHAAAMANLPESVIFDE